VIAANLAMSYQNWHVTKSEKNVMTLKFLIACTALTLSFATTSSQADPYQPGYGCYLKKTSDGFVALRAGPNAKSKRLHKLTSKYYVGPAARGGKWVAVTVSADDGYELDDPRKFYKTGYVASSLINWNDCFYLP
jgi:hypothetical protein